MTRAARRVALVTSSFAPHFGGVEEHVAQVARELHTQGEHVEVWTVDRGRRPQASFLAHDGTSIPVRYLRTPLPARTPVAMARFAIRAPLAWTTWARAFRELRPDVVHVHCFGPNGVYAERLARTRGVPLVVTSHGETMGDDTAVYARSALLRAALRRGIRSASAVTAPTEFVLDDLRRNYGLDQGMAIPNGVDLTVAPAADVPMGRPFFFAVGRLGRPKGFDLLLNAFAQAQMSGFDLVIGGDGPMRDELYAQVLRAGLSDRVHLLGRLSSQEVATWMASSVAVVVPSRQESFGIVALEAWRAGAPLVMTSRGGAAEFVRDEEDGLLVDPNDSRALSLALERLAADRRLRQRLGARGRARVWEFTWARVAQAYRELYPQTGAAR